LLGILGIERPSTASAEQTAATSTKEPSKISVTASGKERR
jgi:hypothetical protein